MMRSSFLLLAMISTLLAGGRSLAAYPGGIVPEPAAERHGLTRAWFTQIQMDRSRGRVAHVVLDRGTLFVQTDQAVLHAIDAETGRTLWAVEVGRKGHPSMAPAANSEFVAVVNGSYLYIVNRLNGKQLWQAAVDGAPGAGPALSEQRAYVATVSAQVLSYRLTKEKDPREALRKAQAERGIETEPTLEAEPALEAEPTSEAAAISEEQQEVLEAERQESLRLRQEYAPPLVCQSTGRSFVQPLVTREHPGEEFVAWPTDRGYLFVGHINRKEEDFFSIRYRLETAAGIAARPTYLPPDAKLVGDSGLIFAASRDGYVHAIREKDGRALWRFSTGEPLVEPAVVIGQRVYAATQPGGLYCLEAKTGLQQWWAPQVVEFVAASKDRAYVVDRQHRLLALDVNTGARLDVLPFPPPSVRMINDQTDRIYLASEDGLIQCLHEIEHAAPILHRVQRTSAPAEPATSKEAPGEEAPGQVQPQQPEETLPDPFTGGQQTGGATENPFGADSPFK